MKLPLPHRIAIVAAFSIGVSAGTVRAVNSSCDGPVPDSLMLATARIENRQRIGMPSGMAAFATGFLVRAPSGPSIDGARRVYLVTNKHAVSRDGTHRTDPVKRIGLHFNAMSDDGRYVKRKALRMTLWKDKRPLWRYHPSSIVDVAVLDVTDLLREHPEVRYTAIDSATLLPWRKLVQDGIDAGREILLLGYPHNVTTAESNFPLVRRGVIASRLGQSMRAELPPGSGNVIDMPGFFVDATVSGSASGSAVIARLCDGDPDRFQVVGIVQGISVDEGASLGRVHDAEWILETIEQFAPPPAE